MTKKKSDVEKIKQLVKLYMPVLKVEWRPRKSLMLYDYVNDIKQIQADEDFLNDQLVVLFQTSFARVCEHINDYYGEKISDLEAYKNLVAQKALDGLREADEIY